MNTPVSFELAKLLKEKGFDILTSKYFRYDGKECENKPLDWNEDVGFFSRPTLAEVVMWLYEKHGIWIEVRKVNYSRFDYKIINGTESLMYVKTHLYNSLLSPTEAYEAAIEYCLTKLI